MTRSLFSILAAGVMLASTLSLQSEEKSPFGMCPIGDKPAKMDKTADYRGKKVYFCCEGCAGAFAKDSAKHATKANHQLVVTGQFKQENCPFSGTATKEGTEVDVGGVKVAFCCGNCKAKVAEAKGDDQTNLVFKNEAFEKAFVATK